MKRLWLSLILALAACPATRNVVVEDSGAARDGDAVSDGDDPRQEADIGAEAEATDADAAPLANWSRQVIYLVMTDRFFNGDPENDDRGAEGCFDPAHPRRFHGGDLAGLRQRLDYLEELGVTALWITPLYRQVGRVGESCGYHGYWPDLSEPDDGAIEPRLGSSEELNALIAELESRDMRVIFDMIVNHAGYGAAVTETHPDWFHPGEGCEALGTPEVYCSLSGLPDFAQENGEAASYLLGVTTGWLGRYAIAGIRMDTAKHVPLEFFSERWIPAVRAARPDLLLIAEVFSGESISQYQPFLEAGFDSAFDFTLHGALIETFARGGSVDGISERISERISTLGLDRALMMVSFLDNHDLPRFMSEAGEEVEPEELSRRYRLALTALMTLPGIPQLYSGDELGMLGRFPDNRRDMPAWAWEAARRGGSPAGYLPEPAEHFRATARLIALRREQVALSEGYYSELWRQNGEGRPNVYAFYRGAGESRVVVVFNNSDVASGAISMPFRENPGITPEDRAAWPEGTRLVDHLDLGAPREVTLHQGRLTFDLPPRTAGIYSVRRFE